MRAIFFSFFFFLESKKRVIFPLGKRRESFERALKRDFPVASFLLADFFLFFLHFFHSLLDDDFLISSSDDVLVVFCSFFAACCPKEREREERKEKRREREERVRYFTQITTIIIT